MKNAELAQEILRSVGKENVISLTHCVTRLRFVLRDEALADTEKIKALAGALMYPAIINGVGGEVAGAIVSAFGSAEYAMVMSSILTIPATVGEGFMGIVIGIPVTVITTLLIVFFGRKSIIAQDEAEGLI